MRRWLVLSLGVGIAALAGYVLLAGSAPPSATHEEIGDQSREQLREILRDAANEEPPTP